MRLNQVIAEHALLKAPDFNKEFVLYTDVSYNTIAGALLQRDESEKLHPVIYVAWKLQAAEPQLYGDGGKFSHNICSVQVEILFDGLSF